MSRIQIYGSTASEPRPFCFCLVSNGLEGYASSDKQLQAAGRTADTISVYTPSFCNANGLTNSWRLISPIPAGAGAKTAAARHEDGHRRERTVAVRQGGIESSRCQGQQVCRERERCADYRSMKSETALSIGVVQTVPGPLGVTAAFDMLAFTLELAKYYFRETLPLHPYIRLNNMQTLKP